MAEFNTTLLVEVALDLASSLSNHDRFDRLLTSIRKAIRCDAVALLAFNDKVLEPLAIQGLAAETLGRRFRIQEHPRLEKICSSRHTLRFSADAPEPDPYDGLLLAHAGNLPVHACMGLPLYSDEQLIGVVTLDSLTPDVFNQIPARTLDVISAMSAASLKTAFHISQLELAARHNQDVLQELTSEALSREGGEMIGRSAAMEQLRAEVNLVANSDYTVLIQGETGVGKELVARNLHRLSNRNHQPLVHVNCASLPETLAEAELFGHTKGAFTGAEKYRAGKFQLANGGTLFLDEVGELPLSIQSKLLRALQSGEIQPVGQDQVERVNVRVIAATNRNLNQEVEQGHFRSDLFHRLSVYPITVPPLSEREEDVLLLAGYFLESTARKLRLRQLKLAPQSEQALMNYSWPGNARELEHLISRAALKARAEDPAASDKIIELQPRHLALEITTPQVIKKARAALAPYSLKLASENFQREKIIEALNAAQGNWTKAAELLTLDRSNLARIAKRLNIKVEKNINA